MCKPGSRSKASNVPSAQLRDTVYGYIKWAMRIEVPEHNKEYREMEQHLASLENIELLPLPKYVADVSARRLTYRDVITEGGEGLDAILDVYSQAFRPSRTGVDRELFKRFITNYQREVSPFGYHLLAIKALSSALPQGMASFFTFPCFGFGGYLVLEAAIRGKGHLAEVISVIERYMVRDHRETKGWLIECDPDEGTAAIFKKCGFYEVSIHYLQPPLWGTPPYTVEQAPVLQLMYKPMGENFGLPILDTEDFLHAMRRILQAVYRVDRAEENPFYLNIVEQVKSSEFLHWR